MILGIYDISYLKDIVIDWSQIECIRVPSSANDSDLCSLLKISNKYLIHNLFKKTVKILETMVPTTYEDYKVAWKTKRKFAQFNVASAAITTGTDIFLPALFYEFSKCIDPRHFDILPAPIIANILVGIQSILKFLPDVSKRIRARKCVLDTCHFPCCRFAWRQFTLEFERHVTTHQSSFAPMNVFLAVVTNEDYFQPGECSSCKTARIDLMDAEGKRMWDQLPKIYNVAESWHELRRAYRKAKESVSMDLNSQSLGFV